MQPETTFIYALLDPETLAVRYVGKSSDLDYRYRQHLRDTRKTYKVSWIKSLKQRGVLPRLQVLEVVPVSMWQDAERWWIKHSREWGADLTNETDGGDGIHGMKHKPEALAKISAASRGNKHGLGVRQSPELVARRIGKIIGHPVSEKTRELIASSKRGKPRDAAVREKLSAALRGKPITAKQRAARPKTLTPEHRAAIKAGNLAQRASTKELHHGKSAFQQRELWSG